MKALKFILKVLSAMVFVAGAVYVVATYGDKIVARAKELLAGCPCCKKSAPEPVAPEAPAEEPAQQAAPEAPAEEAAPAEEEAPAAEEPQPEAAPTIEEGEPVANEEDFEG